MTRTYTVEESGSRGQPLDEACTLCRPTATRPRRRSAVVKASASHSTASGATLAIVLWMCAEHWAEVSAR